MGEPKAKRQALNYDYTKRLKAAREKQIAARREVDMIRIIGLLIWLGGYEKLGPISGRIIQLARHQGYIDWYPDLRMTQKGEELLERVKAAYQVVQDEDPQATS